MCIYTHAYSSMHHLEIYIMISFILHIKFKHAYIYIYIYIHPCIGKFTLHVIHISHRTQSNRPELISLIAQCPPKEHGCNLDLIGFP